MLFYVVVRGYWIIHVYGWEMFILNYGIEYVFALNYRSSTGAIIHTFDGTRVMSCVFNNNFLVSDCTHFFRKSLTTAVHRVGKSSDANAHLCISQTTPLIHHETEADKCVFVNIVFSVLLAIDFAKIRRHDGAYTRTRQSLISCGDCTRLRWGVHTFRFLNRVWYNIFRAKNNRVFPVYRFVYTHVKVL